MSRTKSNSNKLFGMGNRLAFVYRNTASAAITLVAMIFLACAIGAMSYYWSFGQTVDFTRLVFYDDIWWGAVMGAIIQFSPQLFLLLSALGEGGNERMLWLSLFWIFSAFDAATNVGARINHLQEWGQNPGLLALIVGYSIDIFVVFFEELFVFAVSAVAHSLAALIELMGGTAPNWMLITSKYISKVMTPTNKQGQRPLGQQQRSQRPLGQQRPGQQRPGQQQGPQRPGQQRPGQQQGPQRPSGQQTRTVFPPNLADLDGPQLRDR